VMRPPSARMLSLHARLGGGASIRSSGGKGCSTSAA
jgi:hypothetical protein